MMRQDLMAVVPTNAMDVEPSIRDEIIRFFERNKIEYGFGAYYWDRNKVLHTWPL